MVDTTLEKLSETYCRSTARSKEFHARATDYLPGGVTRTLSFFAAYPPYIGRWGGAPK